MLLTTAPVIAQPATNFNSTFSNKSIFKPASPSQIHELDPELVSELRMLPKQLEHEIKEGFFELRQKFKQEGASSIYVSHVVLHEKHPFFSKIDLETLK